MAKSKSTIKVEFQEIKRYKRAFRVLTFLTVFALAVIWFLIWCLYWPSCPFKMQTSQKGFAEGRTSLVRVALDGNLLQIQVDEATAMADLGQLALRYKAGDGLVLDEDTSTFSLEKLDITPGTYGSSGRIPVITVDEFGRITSIGTRNFNEFVIPPQCNDDQKLIWTGTTFECRHDKFEDFITPPLCDAGSKLVWNGTDFECVADNDTDTLATLTCSAGQLPVFDGTTWSCQTIATEVDTIIDSDHDTLVTTQKTPDEDVIRFTLAGTESAAVFPQGITFLGRDTSAIIDPTAPDPVMYGVMLNGAKAALRLGEASPTTWDITNIGEFSIASGRNIQASAAYTLSMGETLTNNGTYSVNFGNSNDVLGDFSFAQGNFVNIGDRFSFGMGDSLDVSSHHSGAFGTRISVSANHSFAGGYINNVTAPYSFAWGHHLNLNSYTSVVIGRYNVGGGNPVLWDPNDPVFEIGNGEDERSRSNAFTVLKKGYVGIGTPAPQYPLEVADRDYPWVVSINTRNQTFAAYTAFQGAGNIHPRAMFSIGNRVRGNYISSAGIWITPEVANGFQKNVFFEVMTNKDIYDSNTKRFLVMQRPTFAEIQSRSGLGNGPGTDLVIWTRPNNNQLFLDQGTGNVGIRTNNPTQTLQVGNSGDGTSAVANSWNTFSDIRFKTDVTEITDPLQMIKSMRGVRFTWKNSGRRSIGFIAQEVQVVMPEIVTAGADGYLSVDYSRVVPVLVEATKELDSKIATLEERLKRLESTANNVSQNHDGSQSTNGGIATSQASPQNDTSQNISSTDSQASQDNSSANGSTQNADDVKVMQQTTQAVQDAESRSANTQNVISGVTIIKAGSSSVAVQFTAPFNSTPIVVASPTEFVVFRVTNVTKQGFTIELSEPAATDVVFMYIAKDTGGSSN